MVKGQYARGHWARANKAGRLLPGPGADDSELDEWIDLPDMPEPEQPGPRDTAEPLEAGEADGIPQAAPPGHLSGRPARASSAGRGKRGTVTATIRRDVEAKIRMITMPTARIWAARDPWCGGTFAEQEPEIAASFAEIVCDSPDLLNFFTGTGGGYMKYFRLFMACLPVGTAVYGHHVAHADAQRPPAGFGPAPDMSQYAA